MQIVTRRENGTLDVATDNQEPSMTQQQFKDQCDINFIMKRHADVGIMYNNLPDANKGVYADLSNVKTYQESLHIVMEAEKSFMQLPAEVRRRFDNDPAQLVEFCNDTKNLEEAISLGLATKKDLPQSATNDLNDNAKSTKSKKTATPTQPASDE